MSQKGFAIITGASKGIGKSMAEELAGRKYNLILVARSEVELSVLAKSLAETHNIKAVYFALDLSEHNAAKKLFDWCQLNKYTEVDILVNNAGYGLWGNFDSLKIEDQEEMISLNVNTLIKLTYYFLPVLKSRNKQTYILNVSSTAAYQAVPTLAAYSASKAFVLTFTRAIRFELRKSTVSVTCLCPGPVNTNFIDRAGMQSIKAVAEKFGMTPQMVASIAVKGMFKKQKEIIPGFLNILSAVLVRLAPKSITEKAAASIYIKE